jgi:branched-chain amino acid transport system ATP-binding protein
MTLIQCAQVTKAYGGLAAVKDLSFSVDEGEFLAIVGPNGAGKTTLFDGISGVAPITSGHIQLDGERIDRESPSAICRKGLARTFQTTSAFDSQNVITNVAISARFGRAEGMGWRSFDEASLQAGLVALEFVGLADSQAEIAGMLPVLDRKRLMLATALATKPRVLLLDEPFGGLNAAERATFVDLLRVVVASGVTVLMIEHVMKAVLALATRVLVLHHGELLTDGPPDVVMRDPRVVEVYLGRTASRMIGGRS